VTAVYYEYWGLIKPPFDNVPDPSMYVDCHSSHESAISETLFAIKEGNECICVIYGELGVGKTLSLRKIIDLLEPDRYRIAFLANPGIPFLQLLREIIGQLAGEACELKRKTDLLSRLKKIIFQNHDEGRKVLIFLDEANSISHLSMESLRLLTNMQKDGNNPFTIVLAGTNELARRLEHPKRENLFQRVGVCCRLEKIKSRNEAQSYIYSRLKLAGATRDIFTEGGIDALWEHSENGVPRIINKLAKLCLKTGELHNLEYISGEIVDQVASRFAKAGEPVLPQRRPRSRHEPPAAKALSESGKDDTGD
jgi:type II secretory pathway predicted ATPase ExeA